MPFQPGQILNVATDIGSDLKIVVLNPNDGGEILYAILGELDEREHQRVASVSPEVLESMLAEDQNLDTVEELLEKIEELEEERDRLQDIVETVRELARDIKNECE